MKIKIAILVTLGLQLYTALQPIKTTYDSNVQDYTKSITVSNPVSFYEARQSKQNQVPKFELGEIKPILNMDFLKPIEVKAGNSVVLNDGGLSTDKLYNFKSKVWYKSEPKHYMLGRLLTSKSSPQYKLRHNPDIKVSYDKDTGIETYNGIEVVAMSPYIVGFNSIGRVFNITYTDGKSHDVVIGDLKSSRDADVNKYRYGHACGNTSTTGDLNVIEFLVNDYSTMDRTARKLGSFHNIYGGDIKHIEFKGNILDLTVSKPKPKATKSKKVNKKITEVALSQVGVKSSTFKVNKYNDWYYGVGNYNPRYAEWCAVFVNWCLNEIGTPNSEGMRSASCDIMLDSYNNANKFSTNTFNIGDAIFYTWHPSKVCDNTFLKRDAEHVGIVVNSDDYNVTVVEGNNDDMVKLTKYNLTSPYILGYGHHS